MSLDITNVAEKRNGNDVRFFGISFLLILIQVVILYAVMKTPVTEFSQNIIKTFIFAFLTISPFYSLLVLYRTIKRKDRILTLKQLFVFVVFSLGFFIFTFVSDYMLVATNRDLDKIPSNIICFIVMLIYMVIQHIFLIRKSRNLQK